MRGYGLNDSFKVPVTVERKAKARVAIEAEVAGTPQEEAANYPANYWLSLFKPPANTQALPGMRNQHAWMSDFKLGCELCHQMGSASARGMRGDRAGLDAGLKKAGSMDGTAIGLGRDAVLDALADWGGRIAAGQVPEAPPRPEGHRAQHGHHPVGLGRGPPPSTHTPTTRSPPTSATRRLYPDGKIWGVDLGNDRLLSVNPVTHEADERHVPTVGGFNVPWGSQVPNAFQSLGQPAPGGSTPHLGAYKNPANPHNPMIDDTGKVWMTTQIRPEQPEDSPRSVARTPRSPDERPPPAARLLRHQHRSVPAHPHLLRHPPPPVRRARAGCG